MTSEMTRAGSNTNDPVMLTEDDPFAHLHKMSTTAGLGSGDYVAINGTAIACILLGIASAFVLFDSPVLLIIPSLGVIAGIVAWQQISASNGTQTGRQVAAIGMLLSLGLGGFYSIHKIYTTFQVQADEQAVVSSAQKLGSLISTADGKTADYPTAYALFDAEFRKRIPLQEFTTHWKQFSASPYVGPVRRIDWNHLLSFETNPVDGTRQATGQMLLYARTREPIRVPMSFRLVDGNWQIDQIPMVFPAEEKKDSGIIGPVRK
jgi:hypothetical protein